MKLPEIDSELPIPQDSIDASSGRNEATNTVALVLDKSTLRAFLRSARVNQDTDPFSWGDD